MFGPGEADTALRLRALIASAPVILFAVDRDGILTLCDGYGLDRLGVPQGSIVGQSLLDRFGDAPVTAADGRITLLRDAIARALDGHVVVGLVSLGDRAFDLRLQPERADRGAAAAGVIGVATDVTDRLATERALADTERRSMRLETSFRALIESFPDVVLVHAEGGERAVTYANPAALATLGYDQRQILDRPLHDLVHPDDRATAASPQPAGGTVRLVKHGGGHVVVESTSVPVTFDGTPSVAFVAHDVTEREEIRAQLLRADRMAALGTLAAGVAHEINNPLTYVLMNVDVVARRLDAIAREHPQVAAQVEPLRASLSQAVQGGTRVREIVRSLATFSRGELDKRARIDVRAVLESSIGMAMHELRHRARLVRDLREVPPVEANEARLGQVFLNLLVNAAHAVSDRDPASQEVRVKTYADDAGAVVVEVSDTGCGIPAADLERIFDPFFTTKPMGFGSGLGLSISHGTVKSLGGDLLVESREGAGTTFRVVLPRAGAAASALNAPSLDPPSARAPLPRRARVLVVDDDVKLGYAIEQVLSDEHDVEVVSDANEALAMIRKGRRWDVVLCDLLMPGMSGMDFYERVEAAAPELARRVVFMTGGACTPRARAFAATHANRVVEKPIDADELLRIVAARAAVA